MEDFSFGNTLSKGSVYESDSIYKAYLDDAQSRLADGTRPVAISNEEIRRGDEILETYRVEDDAIHGGMGSVWRVWHKGWNVNLAMKRPQPRFFAEGSERRKVDFIAECEHWIDMGLHSNIVSCYYVREIGGVPTIFSEWMDGGSLKDAIQSKKLYACAETDCQARILDIAIQTARGIAYSHRKGLVHQDVKPGNILLTKDWDAKVADFGLARAQSLLSDGDRPASTGCTPAYCPREQAEGAAAEKWMDVYAWALTVLEMYAGKRLWETGAEARGLFGNADAFAASLRVAPPKGLLEALARCVVGRTDGFDDLEALLVRCYRETARKPYPRPELNGQERSVTELDATNQAAAEMNNRALSFLDLGKSKEALDMLDQARNDYAHYNRTLLRCRMGQAAEEAEKKINSRLKCLIDLEKHDVRNAWTMLTVPIVDAGINHMMDDSDLRYNHELLKSQLTAPPEPMIRAYKGTAGYLFEGKLLLGVSSDQKPGKLPPENPESMRLVLLDIDTGETLMTFAQPPLYPYKRPFSHVGKVCMSRGGKYAFAVNMNMQPDLRGRSFSTPMERERHLRNEPCYESDVWNRAMGVHVWDGKTGEYLKYLGIRSVGYEGLQGLWADPRDEEIVHVGDVEWHVDTGESTTCETQRESQEYAFPGGYTAVVTAQGDAQTVELSRNGEPVSRYGGGQVSVDVARGIILDAPYPVSHDSYINAWNYEQKVTLLSVRDYDFKAPMILAKMHTTDDLVKAYEKMQRAEESIDKSAEWMDEGNLDRAINEYQRAFNTCPHQVLWDNMGSQCMALSWRFTGRAELSCVEALRPGKVNSPFRDHVSLSYDAQTIVGDSAYTLISDSRCDEPIPVMPMDKPYAPIVFRLSIRSLSTGQARELSLPEGTVHAAVIADGSLYCLVDAVVTREVVGPANCIYNYCDDYPLHKHIIPILREAWTDSDDPAAVAGEEVRHVRWPISHETALFRVSLEDGAAERIGPGVGGRGSILVGKSSVFTAGRERVGNGIPDSEKPMWQTKWRGQDEWLGVSSDAHLLVCGNRCAPGELFLLGGYWCPPKAQPLPELVRVQDGASDYEITIRNLGYKHLTVVEPERPVEKEAVSQPRPEPIKQPEPQKTAFERVEEPPRKGLFARLFGRRRDG